jgi:hypothetical protein
MFIDGSGNLIATNNGANEVLINPAGYTSTFALPYPAGYGLYIDNENNIYNLGDNVISRYTPE